MKKTINGVEYNLMFEPKDPGEHAAFWFVFIGDRLIGTVPQFHTDEEIEALV
jgi:hypothetical protein